MKIDITNIEEPVNHMTKMSQQQYKLLKDSISNYGILQNIVVRQIESDIHNIKKYEIIDGCYRFRAAKELGLKEIECNIIDCNDLNATLFSIAFNNHASFDEKVVNDKLADMIKLTHTNFVKNIVGFSKLNTTSNVTSEIDFKNNNVKIIRAEPKNLPWSPMKRIFKENGANRVADDTCRVLACSLEAIANDISEKAILSCEIAGRKTVKVKDLENASKIK